MQERKDLWLQIRTFVVKERSVITDAEDLWLQMQKSKDLWLQMQKCNEVNCEVDA